MEAVPHKAVCKYFAPAPKLQMSHSDSVPAGMRPSSCPLREPREHSAVTDDLLIAFPRGRQEQGDRISLSKWRTHTPLPAGARKGGPSHPKTVSFNSQIKALSDGIASCHRPSLMSLGLSVSGRRVYVGKFS